MTVTCHVCQRHAIGVGVQDSPRDAVRWLCRECADIAMHIRSAKRMDPYELQALDGGVDAVGAYLKQLGKTDLAEMDELEARMLVKVAWQGSGDRLRKALREGTPF
jgi:hypothetical protein